MDGGRRARNNAIAPSDRGRVRCRCRGCWLAFVENGRNHRGGRGWCLCLAWLAIVGSSHCPAIKAPPFLISMFTQALTSAAFFAPGLSDAVLTFNVSIGSIAAFDFSCFLWEGNRV